MYSLNLYQPVAISLLLLFSSSSFALKSDIEKPVRISADSVLFNKTKGLAVYQGNVSIIQGTLKISAHKIEINAPNNEITKISANGTPVAFQQKMDDGNLAKGQANSVIYLVKDKRLLMDGNASLSQKNDKFSSNHIEYSTQTGELKAGNKKSAGKAGKKGRVNVIFYPTNKVK